MHEDYGWFVEECRKAENERMAAEYVHNLNMNLLEADKENYEAWLEEVNNG